MTCQHVLGLIDAGPFSGYPRGHIEQAWAHARACAACGAALAVSSRLDRELPQLGASAHTVDVTPAVMARIAQIHDAQRAATVGSVAATAESRRDGIAWGGVLAALAAALVVTMRVAADDRIADATSRADGLWPAVDQLPASGDAALTLAVTLLVYAAALVNAVRSRNRPATPD